MIMIKKLAVVVGVNLEMNLLPIMNKLFLSARFIGDC
jgi:hypothetical protein